MDSLEKKADSFSENHPVEKLYVHFDKAFYLAGEVSWYKAYLVNGADFNPTVISSLLYLDWIDPSGTIIEHQRLRIENGGATGDFAIDTTLRGGTYTVRAYTNWMRNDDPALFYSKKIQVIDHGNPPSQSQIPPTSKIDLQFFPEGGTLVEGISTLIVFKAIDNNGRGVEVKGKIVDEQNHVITTFQSVHNGMGTFPFTPHPQKSYKAILVNGETYSLPLPSDKDFVLSASNMNESKIFVRIRVGKQHAPREAYLVGRSRGSICYAGYIKMDSTSEDVIISKEELPEGVLQLTLFNSNGIPQCERMLFITKKQKTVVTIQTDKEQYFARDSITLNFKLSDIAKKSTQASLSVSVTDADVAPAINYPETIYTRLLLQSDMKGYVEGPGWYFDRPTPEKNYALDLVMLTHGWSRYNWEKILSENSDSILYVPERGIALEGKILSNNNPVSNAVCMLIIPQMGNDSVNIYETDSLGHFLIPDLDVSEGSLLFFRVMNEKIKNVKIELTDRGEIPPAVLYGMQNLEENKNENIKLKNRRVWKPGDYRMLEEVIVKSQPNKIRTINNRGIMIRPDAADVKAGLATFQFVSRYAVRLPFATLKYNMWGVTDRNKFAPVFIYINGLMMETAGIDGNPYFVLNSIPIDQIDYVFVFKAGVAVWTKNTSPKGPEPVRQLARGYHTAREFYHPKYEPSNSEAGPRDNRITLYWNANLQVNKDGTATAKFYNTDVTKKLRIVAEGMINGIPVSVTQEIGKTE